MKQWFSLFLFLILPIAYAQKLIIGTTFHNPPFNSLADQKEHFYGFDIDMMGNICKRLSLQCKFIPVTFNNLFTALQAGKIDAAMAGIIITPGRQEEFLFSLPYLESNAQFMTLAQSPLHTPDEIRNKRVGVRLGTPFKRSLALSLYHHSIQIVEYSNNEDLFDGLSNNAVDVILMDAWSVKSWVANNGSLYKSIGSPVPVGEGYGIMTTYENKNLITDINKAILDMEADGTYLKIYDIYFGD